MSYQAELDAIADPLERYRRALQIITHLDVDELGTTGVALASNMVANIALNPPSVVSQ